MYNYIACGKSMWKHFSRFNVVCKREENNRAEVYIPTARSPGL